MCSIISFSMYFTENADQLARKTGYDVVYKLEAGKSYCVFSAHDAAPELLEFQEKYHTSYTIYQSENIESAFFTPAYVELLKRNRVLQYSPFTAALCKERFHIRTDGYFNFDYRTLSSNHKRTIDLLFFGTMTQKRHDILREIQNRFEHLHMVVANDLFHAALDDTLLYTRFVLNISAYENNALETHRINKALACGCRVITNYSADTNMNNKYDRLYHSEGPTGKAVHFCGRTVSDYIEAVTRLVSRE